MWCCPFECLRANNPITVWVVVIKGNPKWCTTPLRVEDEHIKTFFCVSTCRLSLNGCDTLLLHHENRPTHRPDQRERFQCNLFALV